MCKDRNKHRTACFSTRDTANTHLLIPWTSSHDACIVRVSDKTLFILRERISQARAGFQITTWRCRIHRLMCSPSNSQSRSRHRETDEQTGRSEPTRDNGQNLPALPCKNTPATAGKQKHPAVPVPHTNRGRVCSTTKNCAPQNGYKTGNSGNTRTCMVPSVHVRCRFANAFKTCFLGCAQRVFELTLHLIGHFTTLYFTGCGSVRIDN